MSLNRSMEVDQSVLKSFYLISGSENPASVERVSIISNQSQVVNSPDVRYSMLLIVEITNMKRMNEKSNGVKRRKDFGGG